MSRKPHLKKKDYLISTIKQQINGMLELALLSSRVLPIKLLVQFGSTTSLARAIILDTITATVYFKTCCPFGSIFIDCKYFSNCFIFFEQRKRVFFKKKKMHAKSLQKQRKILNEIGIYIYFALGATSNSNFEPLIDFLKNLNVLNTVASTAYYDNLEDNEPLDF